MIEAIITLFWITVDAFKPRTKQQRLVLLSEQQRYELDCEQYRQAVSDLGSSEGEAVA
jgi:hypothetical protein